MSDGIYASVTGIKDWTDALRSIPTKLRYRALRNALAAGARIARDAARANRRTSTAGSPLTGIAVSRYRRHGTVEKAISVRTSKVARSAGDVGVFVNVRPLPRAQQSTKNPSDPFYWRWIEFGKSIKHHMAARPFLQPAAQKLGDALAKFEAVLGPQIQRLDTNPKDPL